MGLTRAFAKLSKRNVIYEQPNFNINTKGENYPMDSVVTALYVLDSA